MADVRARAGDSAFLIDDGTTSVLYDTGFGFTGYDIARNIQRVLGARQLDYIFLTHSHYDHALGCPYILRSYPDAKVVASQYAADVFRREGALRVMREMDRKFADRCGVGEYEFLGDELRVDIPVNDGDIVDTGTMRFDVLALPGHTRCSVGYFCREKGLLLAPETLGVYNGSDIITPAFLVGCEMTIQSIDRAAALPVRQIVSPHCGLLSEAQTAFYLCNMGAVTEDAIRWMTDMIASGCAEEEIIAEFKRRYRKGSTKEAYPEDAVNLNTSIMINLLRRERLGEL